MTKTDWTKEEVRNLSSKINHGAYEKDGVVHAQHCEDAEKMLTAFAERIEADESAVPVAYMWEQFYQHENEGQAKWHTALADFPDYEERDPEEVRNIQPLFTHPPAQETPCSLNEALNVIEHWGRRGNTLNGDDVDRFRALADKIAPAQEQPGWKAPENAIAWMTPGGDLSRSYLWCAERCRDEQRPIPLYLAASPTPPKEN